MLKDMIEMVKQHIDVLPQDYGVQPDQADNKLPIYISLR